MNDREVLLDGMRGLKEALDVLFEIVDLDECTNKDQEGISDSIDIGSCSSAVARLDTTTRHMSKSIKLSIQQRTESHNGRNPADDIADLWG